MKLTFIIPTKVVVEINKGCWERAYQSISNSVADGMDCVSGYWRVKHSPKKLSKEQMRLLKEAVKVMKDDK